MDWYFSKQSVSQWVLISNHMFSYLFEAKFKQYVWNEKPKKPCKVLYFTFRYIDDGLFLNNPYFSVCLHPICHSIDVIYHIIKTIMSASYLNLSFRIKINGSIKTRNKLDDFNIPVVIFNPYLYHILFMNTCFNK